MTSLDRGLSARDVTDGMVADSATGATAGRVADCAAGAIDGMVADPAAVAAARMVADSAMDRAVCRPEDSAAAVWDRGFGITAADAPAEPFHRSVLRPPGYTPRRGTGLSGYERVLARAGFAPVAGIDEAGRGACAGPLVVAAVVFPTPDPPVAGLADSKALAPAVREQVYLEVVAHALSWHAVVIPPGEIDRLGLHVCNIAGMRRALAGISCRPGYVLTDGFPVSGLTVPALAMWKGDQVAACVAAASVVAKVTRDRIMTGLHDRYPVYEFAEHKGYATSRHSRALAEYGPCPEHRFSYVNVTSAIRRCGAQARSMPDNGGMADVARTVDGAGIAAATVDGAGIAAATVDGGAVTGAGYTARAEWDKETSRAS